MNYDEESTPEEDAEDARISAERIASTNWDEQPDANEAMAEEYPEDARLFRQLDDAFPGWDPYLSMLPEGNPEAVEFLRRVDEQLPEAADFDDPRGARVPTERVRYRVVRSLGSG